jgi:hypothetical protein
MHPSTAEILHRHGGAIQTSLWTSGNLDETKRRPTPEGCRIIPARLANSLPEPARTRAQEILKKHPRVRQFIAYVGTQHTTATIH